MAFLEAHRELFLDWETGPRRFSAQAYDRAVYGLLAQLQPFVIRGWHCTRLTEREANAIEKDGMQLPNGVMLRRRIDALLADGVIQPDHADALKAVNQGDEPNRAGMVWFCFYPPARAGESGIGRFFRHWGGEALYNSHEDDPALSAVLARVGVPCLVEAEVPIASLEPYGGLTSKVARRFLVSRGHRTVEPLDHEDRIKRPLPVGHIQRVLRFPEAEFLTLTGCASWRCPPRLP